MCTASFILEKTSFAVVMDCVFCYNEKESGLTHHNMEKGEETDELFTCAKDYDA